MNKKKRLNKEYLRMVLLGPPGAGKGTQAIFISKKHKIKVISVGSILRDEVKKETELGNKIKDDMEKGNLVPDELVNKIIRNTLKKEKNIIIDGFPRDLEEAESFPGINYALHIISEKKEVIKRLLKRAKIEKRKDDNLQTIEHRWDVYRNETMPVVEYYRKKKILRELNGNGSIKDVSKEIENLLKVDILFKKLKGDKV